MRPWLVPLLTLLPSCAAISGFNDLERVEGTAAREDSAVSVDSATTSDSAVLDSAAADSTTTDSVVDTATDTPAFTCPTGTKPPTMINVGGYCIDSTEVTTAMYGAFLVAIGSDTAGQPAECAWNTSYTPSFWPQTGLEAHPVMGVDWCDAFAYCKWAGKRLCGRIGGGKVPYGTPASATASQWFAACSLRGARAFPYGSAYVAAACQDGSIKPTRTVPAGSKLACEGGYTGLLDMSGEVQEWEDSCNGAAGGADLCRVRGGMIYDGTPADLACASPRALSRSTRNDHTGFRCCSP